MSNRKTWSNECMYDSIKGVFAWSFQGQRVVGHTQTMRRWMFIILDESKVKSTIFGNGKKSTLNISLWPKSINHVTLENLLWCNQRGVMTKLPKFEGGEITSVCERFWFRKQHYHPFLKEQITPWCNPLRYLVSLRRMLPSWWSSSIHMPIRCVQKERCLLTFETSKFF